MKKLDGFARFENGVSWAFVIACFAGGAAAVSAVDRTLFGETPLSIRILLLVVAICVGAIVLFLFMVTVGAVIERAFAWIRRRLGMRPTDELEREIRDEKLNDLLKEMDRRHSWFVSLPDSEQRYELYDLNRRQHEELARVIVVLMVAAIVSAGAIVWLAWTARSHG